MIRIWGRTNSINVQKVLWCCAELDVDFERIDAGREFGVTDTTVYLALNPNGLVPTIEDGPFQLWESNVIVRYLANKFQDKGLWPGNDKARFQAEQWMDWQATTLWPALRPLFIQLVRTETSKQNRAVIEKGEGLSLAAARILDAQLSKSSFVAGDVFTMGDVPVAAAVHRWYALDIHHPELPSLRRWYDAMKERPHFRRVVMTPLS